MQTWNHFACRNAAKASRHFCLSRTSGGSLTVTVSIGTRCEGNQNLAAVSGSIARLNDMGQ